MTAAGNHRASQAAPALAVVVVGPCHQLAAAQLGRVVQRVVAAQVPDVVQQRGGGQRRGRARGVRAGARLQQVLRRGSPARPGSQPLPGPRTVPRSGPPVTLSSACARPPSSRHFRPRCYRPKVNGICPARPGPPGRPPRGPDDERGDDRQREAARRRDRRRRAVLAGHPLCGPAGRRPPPAAPAAAAGVDRRQGRPRLRQPGAAAAAGRPAPGAAAAPGVRRLPVPERDRARRGDWPAGAAVDPRRRVRAGPRPRPGRRRRRVRPQPRARRRHLQLPARRARLPRRPRRAADRGTRPARPARGAALDEG